MAKRKLVPVPLSQVLIEEDYDESTGQLTNKNGAKLRIQKNVDKNEDIHPKKSKYFFPQRLNFNSSEFNDSLPTKQDRTKKQVTRQSIKLNGNLKIPLIKSSMYLDKQKVAVKKPNLKKELIATIKGNLDIKPVKSKSIENVPNSKIGKNRIKLNKNKLSPLANPIHLDVHNSVASEPSPAENEFLELETRLKLDEDSKISYEDRILKILEDDAKEIDNFNKMLKELSIRQNERHEKIRCILKERRFSSDFQIISEIPSNSSSTYKKKRINSQSSPNTDGKLLKRFNDEEENYETNPKRKALNLYNQLRSVSKNVLSTPQLNRAGLLTPKSVYKKNETKSIAKIIQKQCLMLHDTPFKN